MAKWKASRDPLFRGDGHGGVHLPVPDADDAIVRHVLYLDGAGRPTPYLSTTEDREVAERFAGSGGRVYETTVPSWISRDVRHVSRLELLQDLKGTGRGRCSWSSAFEVMQARKYVEESSEHLADFGGLPADGLREIVDDLFPPASS